MVSWRLFGSRWSWKIQHFPFIGFTDTPTSQFILNINFSSRTTSKNFLDIIEENIDKRSLKSYGPKSTGKKMIFFIDDLNMPIIDKYGT